MKKTIPNDILQRLLLAKELLRKGEASCSIPNDALSFSIGIVLFHDACEATLSAVASSVNAKTKQNTYLKDYFDLIEEADKDKGKRKIEYRYQIQITLNTLRNNVKHNGILVYSKHNSVMPATVKEFLLSICSKFFDCDFLTLSNCDLIRDEKARKLMLLAEDKIANCDYKQALE